MDYQKMYKILFNRITDVISILQQAQIDTESVYLEGDEVVLEIVPLEDGGDCESEDLD